MGSGCNCTTSSQHQGWKRLDGSAATLLLDLLGFGFSLGVALGFLLDF